MTDLATRTDYSDHAKQDPTASHSGLQNAAPVLIDPDELEEVESLSDPELDNLREEIYSTQQQRETNLTHCSWRTCCIATESLLLLSTPTAVACTVQFAVILLRFDPSHPRSRASSYTGGAASCIQTRSACAEAGHRSNQHEICKFVASGMLLFQ